MPLISASKHTVETKCSIYSAYQWTNEESNGCFYSLNSPNPIWYRGFRGEESVRRWFSRKGYHTLPVAHLMWEDSVINYPSLSASMKAKPCKIGNLVRQYITVSGQYRYAKDDMGWIDNGIVLRCQYSIKRFETSIRRTQHFYGLKKGQETRVKLLMKKANSVRWKLNHERMKKLERSGINRWGTHTAMFPDFLVLLPELTFVEERQIVQS